MPPFAPQPSDLIPLDNEQPWLQQPDENNLWYSRFSQYLVLGPTRSIREVHRIEKGLEKSVSVGTAWSQASQRFHWQRRAQAYDSHLRQVAFTYGNASDVERTKKLDCIIDKLYRRVEAMLETALMNTAKHVEELSHDYPTDKEY